MGNSLDVLNLADAGFPSGAYGHSTGLEYAVQAGWVSDGPSFEAWCRHAVDSAFRTLDLRAALKAWYQDPESENSWVGLDAEVASFRTSQVQREASAQVGRSFLRSVASSYGLRGAPLPTMAGPDSVQFPVAWGAVFRVLDLSPVALADALVFGALRQWTQVAIRIVPLGQKEAFASLTTVLATLPTFDTSPGEASRPLESLAPGLELAGMGMEHLERRYFRS